MATLDSLKRALNQKAQATASSPKQPLSDTQYSNGFDILLRDSGWRIYQDFIVPQLSQQLIPLFNSRTNISALEIGPGPKSIFGYLPDRLKRKITRYTAFEPNGLFAMKLEEWLCPTSETGSPLPYLEHPPNIYRTPFNPKDDMRAGPGHCSGFVDDKYDFILFCHSMYGMKPKRRFIEQALGMLVDQSQHAKVIVFHRDKALHIDGLACHRTASFPTGVVRVVDDDKVLDQFAPFVAGFVMQNGDVNKAVCVEWRTVCRALSRREAAHPDHLSFSSPNVMVAFTQHAATLPKLIAHVPQVKGGTAIKNREARLCSPATIVRPTEVQHVQRCVQWALQHGFGLTVIGGSHSGHCLQPNVVSVDMGAFNQVYVLFEDGDSGYGSRSIAVAEAGCKTGDIVRETMAAGVTVPLGDRPSVGAGIWLQGGIGHLARLHGLACDAIVGAVVVSIDSGQVLCVGCVPSQHLPAGAIRPENEGDLLWAMKGAGTNFGIVISVTFKTYVAPSYLTRNWVIRPCDKLGARLKIGDFDEFVARKLPQHCSADAYLYRAAGQLHIGVTIIESSTPELIPTTAISTLVDATLGPEADCKTVDGIGLFETGMYLSKMHGGHSGGKTSSFKRCLFLKGIGEDKVVDRLVAAIAACPSSLCYLHLLQGGGAVEIAADATAFGCRNWDFACVITGVWPRDQDGTEGARSAIRWVYEVAGDLLPLSSGAYGADLGPDPRDAALAARAFGPNLPRLASLKRSMDPHDVLAYACPLPLPPSQAPMLILLVTGKSGAGKDFCADIWTDWFTRKNLTARAVSISHVTKREYSDLTGTDLSRLLSDRTFKEQHRPALTRFFQERVRQRPQLLKEHFLNIVYDAAGVDVLLVTGMRDEAPVAAYSHLVPTSRLLEVYVQAGEQTRRMRRRCHDSNNNDGNNKGHNIRVSNSEHRPSLFFDNDANGNTAAISFAEKFLLPLLSEDLQQLANMVYSIPDFPRKGVEFRHILGISERSGGLRQCTSLLQTQFRGDWAKVDAIACCEAGGYVFAAPLAMLVDVPLILMRKANKLPPPTVSVGKQPSHISSLDTNGSEGKRLQMRRDAVAKGASVVVVDDVLSTGETLCAILQLLDEAGIGAEDISVLVVAEFPAHRGRELLRRRRFREINVESLLVFGGT